MASVAESSFSPTSPHFFAIVLHHTLPNNRLKIPNKTVRKYGSSFRDYVLLKLPCGSEWKLGLTKSSEGRVYIDKGWLEFSKHYSIGLGHLLSLRYDGNSRFNVVIFDTTTTEIDYPVKKGIASETRNPNNPVKEEEVIEISDDEDDNPPCPRPRKRMRKSHLNGAEAKRNGRYPCTKRYASETRNPKNPMKEKVIEISGDEDDNPTEPPSPSPRPRKRIRKGKRMSAEENERALERASGFKSKHPYFMRAVQPSYVGIGGRLNLPFHFAKSHLGASKQVVLRDPNGRSWLINYSITEAHRKAEFAVGWSAFARENGLKRGDVCVFVLTESIGTVVFEVSFFNDNGVVDSASRTVKPTRDPGNFQPEKPLFSVYMHSSYTKFYMRVPTNFARTYMKNKSSEIRLCVSDGRSWSVGYDIKREILIGQRRHRFFKGWSTFTRESGLEEGDICIFKLTNKDDISFEVRIVKPTHQEYEQMHIALGPKRTKPLRHGK